MLVLTRKIGESVVIGDDIYCTVIDYRNDEVRLAFDAPKSISVHRDEIQRRIFRERQNDGCYRDLHKGNIVDRLIARFKRAPQSLECRD